MTISQISQDPHSAVRYANQQSFEQVPREHPFSISMEGENEEPVRWPTREMALAEIAVLARASGAEKGVFFLTEYDFHKIENFLNVTTALEIASEELLDSDTTDAPSAITGPAGEAERFCAMANAVVLALWDQFNLTVQTATVKASWTAEWHRAEDGTIEIGELVKE